MIKRSERSVVTRPKNLDLKSSEFIVNMAPVSCKCISLPTTPERTFSLGSRLNDCDVLQWKLLTGIKDNINSGNLDSVFTECEDECCYDNHCGVCKYNNRTKSMYVQRPLSPLCNNTMFEPRTISAANRRQICCQTKKKWFQDYFHKLVKKTQSSPIYSNNEHKPLQRTLTPRVGLLSPRVFSKKKRRNATSHSFYCPPQQKENVELREEKHGDVIYSVIVKKESTLSKEAPVTIDKVPTTTKHIKGATISHMVKRLARVYVTDSQDINFLNVFFTTYRTFSQASDVLNILLNEYEDLYLKPVENAAVLRSIVQVLKAWLERYFEEDFYQPPEHTLLRQVLRIALKHDGTEDENCNVSSVIPDLKKFEYYESDFVLRRKNGIKTTFASYVSAKLAVAERKSRSTEEMDSSMFIITPPPHFCDLDVTEEGSLLNLEAAKQLLVMQSGTVAEQLTLIDAKLFMDVLPHHCLASVMSKKRPPSVQATKDQFNRVVYCVTGTVLCPGIKSSVRSKVIAKWIDIAQECREMKNFSSLFAIVSCLKTYAIHRLKRAWLGVPHEHTHLLQELSSLNMKDLIMKVGTAKFNTEDSNISRVRKDATLRRNQDINSGIMHGTVPYLGSFLTDLVHLDTALSNHLEKRRKAFEVLAQLQLWQASCRSYQNIETDESFITWFNSITVLSDEQTYKLSELIEENVASTVNSPMKHHKENNRLQSSGSAASIMSHLRKSKDLESQGVGKLSHSFSGYSSPGQQFRNVKVTVVQCKDSQQHAFDLPINALSNYKTIQINSNERTNAVIRKILTAFHIPCDHDEIKKFSLVQIMPDADKEIRIPNSSNVYYAMNSTDFDPRFILLEEGAEIPEFKRSDTATLSRKTHKKTHRKNNSISTIHTSAGITSTQSLGVRSVSTKSSASPMKSLYKQLAFSSVALASGTYSPSEAAKKNSEISTFTPKDIDDKKKKRSSANVVLMSSTSRDDSEQYSHRRFSADADLSAVVLPVQMMPMSMAYQQPQNNYVRNRCMSESSASRSAPCSPQNHRKSTTGVNKVETCEEDWNQTKSGYTWSMKRAFRKNLKSMPTQSQTKFYISDSLNDVSDINSTNATNVDPIEHNAVSKTKFYIPILSPKLNKRKQKKMSKGHSKTLPPKFVPDFSKYADPPETNKRGAKVSENAVMSPTPSDCSTSSHISDSVFDEELRKPGYKNQYKKNTLPKNYSLTLPPKITIQNPSPTKNDLSKRQSISTDYSSDDSEASIEITLL